MDRPPIEDRAVSLAFINEYEQSLKFLTLSRYEELNSYVLQGTKQSDCQCTPEDKCSHWHGSATDPSLCKKSWIICAFTSKTTVDTWKTGMPTCCGAGLLGLAQQSFAEPCR